MGINAYGAKSSKPFRYDRIIRVLTRDRFNKYGNLLNYE